MKPPPSNILHLVPRPTAPQRVAEDPLSKLRGALDDLRQREKKGPAAFADFERDLHARLMEVERDVVRETLVELDVDAPAIIVDGRVHRRVLRQSQTYQTAAGEVVVERTLYKDRTDAEGECVSPMELSIGMIGGYFTPRAAQLGLWVVAQMTPGKSAELFKRVGNMTPSKTTLDRLPKQMSAIWEGDRAAMEAALRTGLQIPEGTVSIAVSIDGVMAPMEDETLNERREDVRAQDRTPQGPLGYKEVGCATLSFCDEHGDMLGAIRMARAPEAHKKALKEMLARELEHVLTLRPSLRLVKLADATADNWTFLRDELPAGEEVLDFFHASERLHEAVAAAYGDGTRETRYRYESLRDTLRDELGGVDRVIGALKYLHQKHPRRKSIRLVLGYFRTNRKRMRYAEMTAQGLPIGSGLVEAACKTLVTQRLKNSGMRWSMAGAQAVLTARGWDQSERFDQAWALIAATFHADVTILSNVVAAKPEHGNRPQRTSR